MEKYNLITEKKMNTSIETLCQNLPSMQFIKAILSIYLQLNMHCSITIVVVWNSLRRQTMATYEDC